MGRDRAEMATFIQPIILNLGCGNNKGIGRVNVDAYGDPDVVWDLQEFPYPWDDNSVDGIEMYHVLEHLPDWWSAFKECARILKPGGYLDIHVPDESSPTALTYRDHCHVFSINSFHGIIDAQSGTNAWAETEINSVPLKMINYYQVPFKKYEWMTKWCSWLLRFCANHLRGFIWEQQFYFIKLG